MRKFCSSLYLIILGLANTICKEFMRHCMIRTANLSCGLHLRIVVNAEEAMKYKKRDRKIFPADNSLLRSSIIVRIALGSAAGDFGSLLKTVLEQREQLHDIAKKIVIGVKSVKRSASVKGLLLPIADIRGLLTRYNSNIQKLKCYERRIDRRRRHFKTMALWSLVTFVSVCFMNLIIGSVFVSRYGLVPTIHYVEAEDIYQLIIADYNQSTSHVVSENRTMSHDISKINRSSTGFAYDPSYKANYIFLGCFSFLTWIFLAIFLVMWITGLSNRNKIFDKISNIATAERGCTIYREFFNDLYEKSAELQPPLEKDAEQSALNLEEYAVYDKKLFCDDIKTRRLFKKLNLWTERKCSNRAKETSEVYSQEDSAQSTTGTSSAEMH